MQTAKKKITANTKPDGPIKTFFSRKRIIKKKEQYFTSLHFNPWVRFLELKKKSSVQKINFHYIPFYFRQN